MYEFYSELQRMENYCFKKNATSLEYFVFYISNVAIV